jgi:nitrite reductase (NO-forming)
MLGAMPFFAVALLAALPPEPRLVRTQWWLANCGIVALATGFLASWPLLSFVGGLLYLAATALVGWILYGMFRRSILRGRLDVNYYLTAFFFGVLGMLLALLLVAGWGGSLLPVTGLRLAHIHLTLVGWVSMTIVGTMYTFFASIAGAKPGNPRWFAATFCALTAGVLILAIGLLWATTIAILGGVLIAGGAILFGYDIQRVRAARTQALPLAGQHLYAAVLYFVLTCLVGLGLAVSLLGGQRPSVWWLIAYAHVAIVGWIVQTVVGAMLHMLPILAGGPPAGRPAPTTAAAAEQYGHWRQVMAGHGAAQFWLFNGGLWLLAASLIAAPVFNLWPSAAFIGGLAIMAALGLFGRKALLLFWAVRQARRHTAPKPRF